MNVPTLGEQTTIADGRISFTEAYQTDMIRTLTIEHLNTNVKSGLREISATLSASIPYEKVNPRSRLRQKYHGKLPWKACGRSEEMGAWKPKTSISHNSRRFLSLAHWWWAVTGS